MVFYSEPGSVWSAEQESLAQAMSALYVGRLAVREFCRADTPEGDPETPVPGMFVLYRGGKVVAQVARPNGFYNLVEGLGFPMG